MDRTIMICTARGNLLATDADALVNTVNTVGVMGKGIALQFKRAYPAMFREYQREAKAGRLKLGRVHVWATGALEGPRFIVNFPTKGHWRSSSRLEDIEEGLVDLIRVVRDLGIRSIAVPPLGCGNGGLNWADVEPRIRSAFGAVPDVDVLLFAPDGAPAAETMPVGTARPAMSAGRAALVHLLKLYEAMAMEASLIEVQKLLYFLQAAGEPLRLEFTQAPYGPYADILRHVLSAVEGHLLTGFGDGSSRVLEAEPIRVLPGADDQAKEELARHPETVARINRVLALATGFESMYGMELLASVHWVVTTEGQPGKLDLDAIIGLVQGWTRRKGRLFSADHVTAAWRALDEQGWLAA